jgi:tRNA A22 N-methylase
MDLLGAVSVLFGDCSMNPNDEIIYIGGVKATPEQLAQATTKATEAQAEYDNNQYQRDRQYPSIGDQLDMIFHAGLGGDAFQAAIQAVKDKHPKGDN